MRVAMQPRSLDLKERIKNSIVINDEGCWIWQKAKDKRHGFLPYGRIKIYVEGKPVTASAHRKSYEAFVGDIPKGLQLDHLCKNPTCVNPEHLEPVTCKENLHRSSLKELWATRRLITHCPQNHEYTEENTFVKKSGRNCRTCHRERELKKYHLRKGVSYAT